MGAAQTSGDRWKQPTEKEQRRWRLTQTNSRMIQQLSRDVDAQYHCFQPYLLLTDIIRLYRTCHMWSYWIRSPGSVVHRSQMHAQSRARNSSRIITIRNSNDLLHLSRSQWIQGYLYGCHIQPPIDERTQWISLPVLTLPFNLKPLAELKRIRHLTLGHIDLSEVTPEKTQIYFTALSPNLCSLELVSMVHGRIYGRPTGFEKVAIYFLNSCLSQIHLLTNLEELRLTISCDFNSLYLNDLPKLSHLHTFICTNRHPYDESQSKGLPYLAACTRLKHCSWGRYEVTSSGLEASVEDVKSFLSVRTQYFRPSSLSSDSLVDPMEYFDSSTIWMDPELLTMIVNSFPNLKTERTLTSLRRRGVPIRLHPHVHTTL